MGNETPLNPALEYLQHRTRRHFFKESAAGIGAMALSELLSQDTNAAGSTAIENPLRLKSPHFAPKAKQVIYLTLDAHARLIKSIYLHLTGSPPHLDLFDYKPELVKRNDQDCPDDFLKGKRFAFTSGVPKLM